MRTLSYLLIVFVGPFLIIFDAQAEAQAPAASLSLAPRVQNPGVRLHQSAPCDNCMRYVLP